MKLNKRIQMGAVAGLACAVAFTGSVLADGDEHGEKLTGVYYERHEVMEDFRDYVKPTVAMLKGEAEFDLAAVKAGAADVAKHSGDALLELFPEGTNEGKSESLDNIWTDWENFSKSAHLLKTRAEAVAAAEDQASATGAFIAMTKSCGGCHETFRKEEDN